jgi:hypothetical protein
MTGYVYTWTQQTAQQLDDWVSQVQSGWAYVERETDVKLIWRSELLNTSVYSYGRIFNPEYELRWQEIAANRFIVQYLSETELDIADCAPRHFEVVEGEQHLFGTHISALSNTHYLHQQDSHAKIWIETRIPRPLYYPISSTGRKVLLIVRYYLEGGLIKLTRWCALEDADARS